jgi:P-type Cu+ transporter
MPVQTTSVAERTSAGSQARACAHCGDPCGAGAISGDQLLFCCSGCKSVYEILQQHGLCDYYDREDAGVRMRDIRTEDDQYTVLADNDVETKLLSFASNERNRIVWTIPTLHCVSCVWLLEQLDRLDTGILSSTVDIMRKTATIDYDPRQTSLRSIAQVLRSIGYAPLIRLEGSGSAKGANRALYARIGLAAFASVNTMLIAFAQYLAGPSGIDATLRTAFITIGILLSVPVLLYSASPWFTAARSAIRQKRISLDVPVAIGILALFVRSMVDIAQGTGEGYLDSFNALVFLLLIGRLFQQKAFDALSFDRTYRSFFPLSVGVLRGDHTEVLPIEQITIGDRLSIRNGEVIPCDSTLASEIGYVDYSFVTGESVPVEAMKDQTLYAGGRVVGRALTLIATKAVSHSELANMWDRTSKRSTRQTFLTLSDTFGRWFTLLAIVVALSGALIWLPDWKMAFNVFTAVLIIACPCALTLAAPITLGTAMGRLGELGIYLKNIGTLLDLQRIDAIFFDKTGTLTEASHQLDYTGRPLSSEEWEAVSVVASQSAHPVSRSIAADHAQTLQAHNVMEFIGRGVSGTVGDTRVELGSFDFVCSSILPEYFTPNGSDDATHVAINGRYVGAFTLKSTLRDGIAKMIRQLLGAGKQVKVITGDSSKDKHLLQSFLGSDNLVFDCRPEEKIERVEAARANGLHVLMVGDGLNDAGAMGAADIAIAVTEDTATLVPACDVIMRSGSLRTLPSLISYAQSVKNVIMVSFITSIAYNALGLTLAIMGLLTPLMAAILMPVSSLTVIAISVFGARGKLKGLRLLQEEPA